MAQCATSSDLHIRPRSRRHDQAITKYRRRESNARHRRLLPWRPSPSRRSSDNLMSAPTTRDARRTRRRGEEERGWFACSNIISNANGCKDTNRRDVLQREPPEHESPEHGKDLELQGLLRRIKLLHRLGNLRHLAGDAQVGLRVFPQCVEGGARRPPPDRPGEHGRRNDHPELSVAVDSRAGRAGEGQLRGPHRRRGALRPGISNVSVLLLGIRHGGGHGDLR
mmetsp:Transcript_58753/g.124741  ORF Transcript_58753/g.124741 Transcript_58753/m.124741 type:complete len:224 (+) Transcript_58753:412-1083(+)